MRSRFLRFAVPLLLMGLVAAACSNNDDNSGASGATGETGASGSTGGAVECNADIKVGVAFDVGGLGDKSFNDAANAGLQKAIADGLVCEENTKLVPANAAGSNLDSSIRRSPAPGISTSRVSVSRSPRRVQGRRRLPGHRLRGGRRVHPVHQGCDQFPNVLDLSFAANEGHISSGSPRRCRRRRISNTVGFLGGQTGPLIGSFEGGYEAGVASVDKNIKVLVEYIGDSTQAFVNPTAGKALSEKMYSEGADVIYHAAGLSGAVLFQAAAEKSKYAIGVDSDQYLTASAAE
jgi:basic membrane protein A